MNMSSLLNIYINQCVEIKDCNELKIGFIKKCKFDRDNTLMFNVLTSEQDMVSEKWYPIDSLSLSNPEQIILTKLNEKMKQLKQINKIFAEMRVMMRY
jgi:hypothetical protein